MRIHRVFSVLAFSAIVGLLTGCGPGGPMGPVGPNIRVIPPDQLAKTDMVIEDIDGLTLAAPEQWGPRRANTVLLILKPSSSPLPRILIHEESKDWTNPADATDETAAVLLAQISSEVAKLGGVREHPSLIRVGDRIGVMYIISKRENLKEIDKLYVITVSNKRRIALVAESQGDASQYRPQLLAVFGSLKFKAEGKPATPAAEPTEPTTPTEEPATGDTPMEPVVEEPATTE